MSIENIIVDVNILLQTGGISTKNFSTIMLLSKNATVRYKEYSSTTDVKADYAVTDPEYYAALALFSQDLSPQKFAIGRWDATGGETILEALSAVNAANKNWYGLVVGDSAVSGNDLVLAATWARSNDKFHFIATNDTGIKANPDTTSVAALLNTAGVRADVTYNAKFRDASATGWIDLCTAAYHLTRTAGSYTPANHSLQSCTIDNLTTAEVGIVNGKQANVYVEAFGVDIMWQGLCTGSDKQYTDTIIGADWLKARIQEEVFLSLRLNNKVPYTDAGITIIESAVASVLKKAVDNGLLASFKTTAQSVADQPTADRAARKYSGLTWEATLAGAIHSVTITGTVRV